MPGREARGYDFNDLELDAWLAFDTKDKGHLRLGTLASCKL